MAFKPKASTPSTEGSGKSEHKQRMVPFSSLKVETPSSILRMPGNNRKKSNEHAITGILEGYTSLDGSHQRMVMVLSDVDVRRVRCYPPVPDICSFYVAGPAQLAF